MDFKLAMATEVAAMIGARVLDQRCDSRAAPTVICGWPLMEKPDQGMPFCWGCTTDKKTAMQGRALLLRAQMAEHGITIAEAI